MQYECERKNKQEKKLEITDNRERNNHFLKSN